MSEPVVLPWVPSYAEAHDDPAGSAARSIASLKGIGSILGNGFAKGFEDHGAVSLMGAQITCPEDLAVLGQVYRNPGFETLRIFMTKAGRVVGQMGVTSRMASSASLLPTGMSRPLLISQLSEALVRLRADGWWMLHNHPSGEPSPSLGDLNVTQVLRDALPGFQGHVIVNHAQYGEIVPFASEAQQRPPVPGRQVLDLPYTFEEGVFEGALSPLPLAQQYDVSVPVMPHPLLGRVIRDASDFARLGNELKHQSQWMHVIGLRAHNGVQVIAEISVAEVEAMSPAKQIAQLRRFQRQTGSASVALLNVPLSLKAAVLLATEAELLLDAVFSDANESSARSQFWTARSVRSRGYLTENEGIGIRLPSRRDAILVDDVWLPRLTSEGRPIHPTEEGIANFWRWFGGSAVIDKAGRPVVAYRGEHGDHDGVLVTQLGSITFSDVEAGNGYALEPNQQVDVAACPRVVPAFLQVTRPLINTPDDPFIEFADIIRGVGPTEALRIALKFADQIEDTSPWQEREIDALSVADLLSREPHRLSELYMKAWPFFDDTLEVTRLARKGFDGAIHGGMGAFDGTEYRLFSEDQAMSLYNDGVFKRSTLHRAVSAPRLAVAEPGLVAASPKTLPRLRHARDVAHYMVSISVDEVDQNAMEDYLEGAGAYLRRVAVADLVLGDDDHHVPSELKQARYDRLSVETMPPLVIDRHKIVDGHHRYRSLLAQGAETVLVYDIVDADKVATAPLSSTAFVPPASPLSVPVVPAHELRLSYDPESTLAVYQEGVLPLDGRKVDALLALLERGDRLSGITIDPQGQVVDGHHRWMAHAMAGKPLPVSHIRIERDGVFVEVPVHNDQGDLIHGDPAAIDNFWRWFGQSQLVDGQGRPMVLFHGTATNFDAFSGGRGAFYFTDDRKAAGEFATHADCPDEGEHTPRVVEAFVAMHNPLVLDRGWYDVNVVIDGEPDWMIIDSVAYDAQAAGYDGLLLRGFPDFDGMAFEGDAVSRRLTREYDQFLAFDPVQIKSIHNDGAFDPTSPSLLDKNKPILSPERHDVLPPDNAFINRGNGACEL